MGCGLFVRCGGLRPSMSLRPGFSCGVAKRGMVGFFVGAGVAASSLGVRAG